MSQSPASSEEVKRSIDADSIFRQSLKNVNELIRRGASLSGHERNCAFLNLRGTSFATVGAVTGIDFPDDGRGMATVDWDADGDVDLWLSNRTSPRIRFLRNDLANQASFIQLRLKGTTCNRDAIGARVTVYPANSTEPLIKTLRAGEGYLSQSSKWLHFGLGSLQAIDSVAVAWPGGEKQIYRGLDVNHRYELKQGVSQPRLIPARTQVRALEPATQPVPESTHVARIPLRTRIPVPRLPFATDRDASFLDAVEAANGRPFLMTLWASWCGHCRMELAEIAEQSTRLEQAGLVVVALNVDEKFSDRSSGGDPHRLLAQIGWSEANTYRLSGRATDELIARLQTLHELPFGRPMTMPLPISFLIDGDGELAVIYRGRMSIEHLLSDIPRLTQNPTEWQMAALPMPGRWNEQPAATDLLEIPRQLLNHGQTQDALLYIQAHEQRLAANEDFPMLRGWLGDQLLKLNRASEGRTQYEAAVEAAPDDVTLLNNLAWLLATHPDAGVRDGQRAVHWALRAAKATKFNVAGVLDTLAASYAEAGDFDKAQRVVARANQLASAAGNRELVEKLRQRAAMYTQGRPYRQ